MWKIENGRLEVVEEYGMWFERDVGGIKIKFRIKNYKRVDKENWDSEWCQCDFLFSSDCWLNYHRDDYEILLCSEVDELIMALTELLDNKILETKEIDCIEPDFIFTLYPKEDLRNNPKYTYIKPGSEIQDIYLEWRIFFWNDGITDNHLTLVFDRDDITSFRDYLVSVGER